MEAKRTAQPQTVRRRDDGHSVRLSRIPGGTSEFWATPDLILERELDGRRGGSVICCGPKKGRWFEPPPNKWFICLFRIF